MKYNYITKEKLKRDGKKTHLKAWSVTFVFLFLMSIIWHQRDLMKENEIQKEKAKQSVYTHKHWKNK